MCIAFPGLDRCCPPARTGGSSRRQPCDRGPAQAGRPALISVCAYVDSQGMDEITILQAEVLKTLASPRRIEILHALAHGPIEVGRLAETIGASQPNVSQHLAVLRTAGIVEAERDGREVRYRLVDPDVMVACSTCALFSSGA